MTGPIIIGVLIGIVLTVIFEIIAMRSKMLVVHSSRFEFDETVERVEEAIEKQNWTLVESGLLNENLEKKGVHLAPQVHLLKLCKAEYAAEVLRDNRPMACLMPCTIAVYETDDGDVEISKINTGIISKIFGGTVARVMGGKVAKDEEEMLRNLIEETQNIA
ncbi:DUF302 domain-containing protein [Desulfonema magnum]|uniref:DUF302 n=1 Tax=Desulfonema magnum TaxID=45655 RepID=A0A975GQ25_9BACT|nr:DUF302 domain-containing protein [Desulfonema magnum]QTA89442.1 DUF302 [Desulfonema magnum]